METENGEMTHAYSGIASGLTSSIECHLLGKEGYVTSCSALHCSLTSRLYKAPGRELSEQRSYVPTRLLL